MINRRTIFHVVYWVAAIVGIMLLQYFYGTAQTVARIPYSEFQQLLQERKIAEIAVSDKYIQGKLKSPLPNGKSQFTTVRVDPQFADDLRTAWHLLREARIAVAKSLPPSSSSTPT